MKIKVWIFHLNLENGWTQDTAKYEERPKSDETAAHLKFHLLLRKLILSSLQSSLPFVMAHTPSDTLSWESGFYKGVLASWYLC